MAAADWRAQLAQVAALPPNWCDPESPKGPWGVAPDEGAVNSARALLERLGDAADAVSASADPLDGSIHLYWSAPRGSLSLYVEAGYVPLILGHERYGDCFDPDREDVSLREAEAIARAWLAGA
jgi:hypothetical protein